MGKVSPAVYAKILSVRQARRFDAGGTLMRLYAYMMNIGTVSMLTLAGHSFLIAGSVSSVIAFSIFLIAPRIGKLADEQGQSKVIPKATAIALAGLCAMLADVALSGPEWVLFVAAIPMGFLPNAQSLVRARWTYLLRTGKLGKDAPPIRSVFSYEGIIDDSGLMLGPPIAIALGASIAPIAGMAFGGAAFLLGAWLLCTSRESEPIVGWSEGQGSSVSESGLDGDEDAQAEGSGDQAGNASGKASVIREMPIVRVLFLLMFCTGALFGIFDTSSISLSEELGNPNIVSIGLVISAAASIGMGFVFGMIHIRSSMAKQLLAFGIVIGIAYSTMALIDSELSFYVVSVLAALSYAPFLITANSACERAVPGKRLTESLAWLNSGATCGLALGPTIAGIAIDLWGYQSGFRIGAVFAIAIPIFAIIFSRVIFRSVRSDAYESVINHEKGA